MRSFTLIQKRAYLSKVISKEENVKRLTSIDMKRFCTGDAPDAEPISSWDEKQIDAVINEHIRSTVKRLTNPAFLQETSHTK